VFPIKTILEQTSVHSKLKNSRKGKSLQSIQSRFRKVLGLIILFCAYVPAQSTSAPSSDIQTMFVADRPGQTTPPTLVAKGVVQIESGIWTEQSRTDGISQTSWLYPTTLVRIGMQTNWELRIQCDVAGVPATDHGTSSCITGVSGISIGSKFSMTEENGYIPKTAFLAAVKLPSIGDPSLRPSYLAPSMGLCFQNTISDQCALGYGVLSSWDGTNAASQQLLSISLNYNLTNSIGSFIEYYLNTGEASDPTHAIDFGFSYMLLKNLQLDISGGFGLNAKALDSGFGFGIAFAM
jgi:hypothetical protein